MIFDGEFWFHGIPRWNLGWPSPNYAGAFLAAMWVLAWVFSSSRGRWRVFAAEAGSLFLLAKTYSREAVVAWVAAWVFGFCAGRAWRNSGERPVWIARVVMLWVAGFGWSRALTVGGGPARSGPVASDRLVAGTSGVGATGETTATAVTPADGARW